MTINKHEAKFAEIISMLLPNAAIEREYKFDKVGTGEVDKKGNPKLHRWRFDFALLDQKIAFEIEGGIWIGGRHIHPLGFIKDCHKYNAAAMQGWKVFRLTPDMITIEYIRKLLLPD